MIALASVLVAAALFALALLALLVADIRRGRETVGKIETSIAAIRAMRKDHAAILGHVEAWLARPRRAVIGGNVAGVMVDGLDCISGEARIGGAGSEDTIVVSPKRTAWFEPSAMRISVHADGDPCVEQRVEVLSAEINGHPQWDGSSVDSIESDFFQTPAGLAVSVSGMSPISTESYLHELRVMVANRNLNSVRVVVQVFGKGSRTDPRMELLPEGCDDDAADELRLTESPLP